MPALKIAISGISGRLGQAIASEIVRTSSVELVGGMVSSDSVHLGADIGEIVGTRALGIPATVALEQACEHADIVIDATIPAVTAAIASRLAAAGGPPLVTGVTGLDETQTARLETAAEKIAVLQASNFSLGVALVESLVATAARALHPDEFDLEIHETHHRRKTDSPSGTALTLGRAAAKARGQVFEQVARFERPRTQGQREAGEIGFSVQRGGGVVGEHEAAFLSELEAITLAHRAFDRRIFARGAVSAARWLVDRPAGLYTMKDLLQ